MMTTLDGDRMRITLASEVDESYDIIFGERLFPRIAGELRESPLGDRYAIIADTNTKRLFAQQLMTCLRDESISADVFSFMPGERYKRLMHCERVMEEMHQSGYGRDAAILALGGGVVTDMAGLVADLYYRGIPYAQIPTTLVAQADASIGGKVAVNTRFGKNIIGDFYQPKRVYIDIATIRRLPQREYSSGLAETIKHGMIKDSNFFFWLEEHCQQMKDRDPGFLLDIAKANCRIKGDIVETDPHEEGIRKILNYGHTIGHPIEILNVELHKRSGSYLSHGAAIAIGMMVAGNIALLKNNFYQNDLARQEQLLISAGLPTTIPPEIPDEQIIELTSGDKKAKCSVARYALPLAIGFMNPFKGEYAGSVEPDILKAALQRCR